MAADYSTPHDGEEHFLERQRMMDDFEALENVLGHIGALDVEYKHRFAELEKQLGAAS